MLVYPAFCVCATVAHLVLFIFGYCMSFSLHFRREGYAHKVVQNYILCQVLLDRKTSIKIQQTVFFARSKNEDFAIILCICRFILLTPCMKNHVSDVMNSVSKSAAVCVKTLEAGVFSIANKE